MDSSDSDDSSSSEEEHWDDEVEETAEELAGLATGNGPVNEGREDHKPPNKGPSKAPQLVVESASGKWRLKIPALAWAETRQAQIRAGLEAFHHAGFLFRYQVNDGDVDAGNMLAQVVTDMVSKREMYEDWEMASSAFWCILIAQRQKYIEWQNKWVCSGKYEQEVDKARECWTLLNMHKVMAGDKGHVFKDPNGGDGAYMTGFAGKPTKKMGFSIAVYGSKEKRRRLDVKKLGNDEMQVLKVNAFQYVRERAGINALPDCIANRTKPGKFLFQKSNSAREKALERVGGRMDAVDYQNKSHASHTKSREVFSGFMRKKERAPSPIKGLVRPEDEELIGGVDFEGLVAPAIKKAPAKGATRSDSPDMAYLEEPCRAPSPEVDKPPETDKDAFFLQKMSSMAVPVPESVKTAIELAHSSSEATQTTAPPSDLSEMEMDAEEEEEQSLALQQQQEDLRRQRKEEKKRQRRVEEANANRVAEQKQQTAVEAAALERQQAEEQAKAATAAALAIDDEEEAMARQMELLKQQMEAKRVAKQKAAQEAAEAVAVAEAATKAEAEAAAARPSTEEDSDSDSDSESDSEEDDSSDEEEDGGDGVVHTGPYNEGTESDASSMNVSSRLEDPSDDDGEGPESVSFFLRNADSEMFDNAERLMRERVDEEAEQAVAGAQSKGMSEGMKQRLKRVFKAKAKEQQCVELTPSDQKDLEWYNRLDVGDDGEVQLNRKKRELTFEQQSKRMRKKRIKHIRAEKRREDRDERRSIKQAEQDERQAASGEKKKRRIEREQARLQRREMRDKNRVVRNVALLNDGLRKHYCKERDKLQKRKDKADAKFQRQKTRNRMATKINPFTGVLTLRIPEHVMKKKQREEAKMADGSWYSANTELADREGGASFAILHSNKEVNVNLFVPGCKPGTRAYDRAMKKRAEEDAKEKEQEKEQAPKRQKITIEPPQPLEVPSSAAPAVACQ